MYFINLCQQILRDMWGHKMRSALALFGIIWGTITVILLLALGSGFTDASRKNMMTLVDGTFFVMPGATSKSYQGFPKGRPINVKAQIIMDLKRQVPGIKDVSPMLSQRTGISFHGKQRNKEIFGAAVSLGYLQKINMVPGGRFINQLDVKNKAQVIILGDLIQSQLFGNRPALGKIVEVNNVPFTVVGLVQEAERNVYNWYRNRAIIPYSTYVKLFGDQNSTSFITLPYPDANSKSVQNAMRSYFAHKYHFAPNDEVALNVFDTTEFFQFMRWFFIGLQIFLGICGALTLGVGSLGVANIMFLIVNERTKEIGVRIAIGAADWHILLQIILEALMIIGIGGAIGFLVSYFTVAFLQHISLPNWLGYPVISVHSVLITIIILALLGLIAGYFPARKASKMDPVEALGY